MAIEGLDAGEELAIIAARDEDSGVGAGGGLEDGERAGGQFVGFDERDFVLSVICVSAVSINVADVCG